MNTQFPIAIRPFLTLNRCQHDTVIGAPAAQLIAGPGEGHLLVGLQRGVEEHLELPLTALDDDGPVVGGSPWLRKHHVSLLRRILVLHIPPAIRR